jgi:hypothetical protein
MTFGELFNTKVLNFVLNYSLVPNEYHHITCNFTGTGTQIHPYGKSSTDNHTDGWLSTTYYINAKIISIQHSGKLPVTTVYLSAIF